MTIIPIGSCRFGSWKDKKAENLGVLPWELLVVRLGSWEPSRDRAPASSAGGDATAAVYGIGVVVVIVAVVVQHVSCLGSVGG